ncbi:putative uncharacterized protein C19orf81 homolog isoform X2 [Mixophyes fleayi]
MEPGIEDNEISCSLGDWKVRDQNELSRHMEKLESDIAHPSGPINGQSILLKPRKHSLQQIIKEYEGLNLKIPCCRKFQTPPASQPLALCMECPSENDFSHWDILKAIEQILPKAFEKKQLTKIQFENTNIVCETAGHKNRWLITVSDFQIRNRLFRSGLMINGKDFLLRCHDDVIAEDYKQHLRRALAKQKIVDMLSSSKAV